jgi:regulatory protein
MNKIDSESLHDTLFPATYTVTAAVYSRLGESVKLTLSGEEKLVLPSDRYALMQLREGSLLSREALLELKQVEARYMARKKALQLLERRAYTGAQLKFKLSQAMYPREIIRDVLADLTERGYLDDEKYAEGWIAAQIKRKPQGRRLLFAGLARKGVNRREAERLIASAYPPEREEEQCEQFMKKLACRRGWEADNLLPAVARRGFDIALIKKVYRRIRKTS